MCKKLLFTVVVAAALMLGTTAMAADIAFYVGAPNVDGWYDVASMNADVATIIDQTSALFDDIQKFDDTQFAAFGAWVDKNTDDGELDIIWLNGCMPSVLYTLGNAQPDGSRAEKWLDGGNMFINVGDWFGYCSYEGGPRQSPENGSTGAANILDLSSGIIVSADNTALTATPAGQEYLPSMGTSVISYRPIALSAVVAPWEVAAVFAQTSAGTQADPVVIHNTDTDGYVAFINQSAGSGPPGWLNDRGLTCAEFINNWVNDVIGLGANPYARHPDPKDGALHTDTWVTVSWQPGDFAASHDVYMGDNFDDVNNATRDSEAFRGNQPLKSTYAVAGFVGFPYPDGLVPGTTYYWRIDEVNAPPDETVYKGPVWSFSIPSRTARLPVPANGSAFIDPTKAALSWTAGFGAKLHFVYFGDDYDTVANAAGAMPQGLLTYNPGPLELEKTYYWRVDESDGANTYTGDVWSFRTAKEGGGVKAQYYNGMNFENLVVTRIDPQIDFNWGDPGSPDPKVGNDSFSARWTGEVEAAFTETYTFYPSADDGVRLWVNGVQLVNAWIDQSTTEYRGTIDLVAGNTYSLIMEYYENGGGAVAQLRWSSPSTPKQIIPQAALSPPIRASAPSPASGATGTKMTPILKWNAGDYAASHEVYFGTDEDAVMNADKSSPEYKGTKALGNESYDPGKLDWFTTYYWRVDEVNAVNPDSPWVGNVWSFTTGDFILIDDFEAYNSGDNQIWYSWKDGLGYGSAGTADYYAGNGTGAAVGDETTNSYTEETIVHGGHQSMPLAYDNNKTGFAKYSETELTLTDARDWTDEGVANLSLWFRGYPASTGSFVESPAGTFTMTASGADIWAVNGVEADEFHFAYKMLNGAGSITAKVVSVGNSDPWAKAGVMIRESLNPDSAHAFACITPDYGVAMQYRPSTGGTSANYNQTGVAAPYWVKVDRSISGLFTVSQSANGTSWQPVTGAVAQTIAMGTNVYIGLALTAHNAALTCQAVFSNVTTTGNVTGQWAHQDIGIVSNAAEPLYVAVSNSTGNPAIVVNTDPAAAQVSTWTEWVIPLSAFSDQGINLANVDSIAIGLGTRGNMTVAGGSGKIFIDDIRLYRPTPEPEPAP
jgi:hypothetical protein